jgi:hypothetical protein
MKCTNKNSGSGEREGERGVGDNQKRSGGRTVNGVVLRVSSAGFGFIGDSQSARKRYHFHFRDVNGGDRLNQNDKVSYESRMNDSMEYEAFNITKLGSSVTSTLSSSSASSSISRSSSSASSAWKPSRDRREDRPNSNWVENVKAQQTKDQTDQWGKKRAVGNTGNLLAILGVGGGQEGVPRIATSPDDYDVNPDGGIGFSQEYQAARLASRMAITPG